MQIKDKILKRINFDKITFLFLCIQPFLEIYYLYHFDGIKGEFTFSPSTLIRILLYLCIFVYFMFKNKIKDYKIPFIYGVIVLLYFMMHHLILKDTEYFFIDNYSLFGELFYIIRLTLPILSIYVYYKMKYNSDSIYKGTALSAFIFSVVMIFTNIFMIALPSYYSPALGVETNIFGWLFANENNYNYYQLATKGIFNFTNCLASGYVLIFTLLLIRLKKENNKFNFINIVLLIISLFMLGSRVSSYFPLIILLITLCMYTVINFINKKKNDKKYILNLVILIIISSLILPVSPISKRSFELKDNLTGYVDFETLEKEILSYKESYELGIYDKTEIANYIRENHQQFLVHRAYLDSYKVEEDLEFWINYYLVDKNIRGDNRLIQKSIIERINEKTFNSTHLLFGYTYTGTYSNGLILERDFAAQYFYLGLLGVLILLFPYVLVCLYTGIKSLISIRKIDFEITMLLLGIGAILFISLLSGNSIEQFIVSIPLAITSGYMLKKVKEVY